MAMGNGRADEILLRLRIAFHDDRATGRQTKHVAEALGVPASTVRNWATGTKMPPADKFPAIADLLGVSERWLLRGETNGEPERLSLLELSLRVAQLDERLTGLETRQTGSSTTGHQGSPPATGQR